MPCHHNFFKMSHPRAYTKYGENTSFIHQEIYLGLEPHRCYLATFTKLTLNDIQKRSILSFFQEKFSSIEEVTSLTKTSSICFI